MGRDADFASRAGPSYAPRCLSSFRQITVRGECFVVGPGFGNEVLRRFVAGAADHGPAGGEHPIHRRGTVPGRGKAYGSAEGWNVAGGHPRFSREAPMPPERPGASRHRYPPRDPVDSRTHGRWSGVPVQRTHRRSLPARRRGQALEKDARQVEAPAGRGAYTAGTVSMEESAILTVAGACDGTTAGRAARRTRGVARSHICDQSKKIGRTQSQGRRNAERGRAVPSSLRVSAPLREASGVSRRTASWARAAGPGAAAARGAAGRRCTARPGEWRAR